MFNLLVRFLRLVKRHFLPSLVHCLLFSFLEINFPANSKFCHLFCVFTRAWRGLGQRLDHVHQSVASGDVNSAVFIRQTSIREIVRKSSNLKGNSFRRSDRTESRWKGVDLWRCKYMLGRKKKVYMLLVKRTPGQRAAWSSSSSRGDLCIRPKHKQ